MTDYNAIPEGLPGWLAPHAEEVAGWGPVAGTARGCWVAGCRRDAALLGLCAAHHQRAKRAWRPSPSEAIYARDKRKTNAVREGGR